MPGITEIVPATNEPAENAVEDRRDTIEAAFEAAEAAAAPAEPAEPTAPAEPVQTELPLEPTEPKAPVEAKMPAAPTEPKDDLAVDKAPQSWRAPQKAQWAALPADVRQEIVRRERETTKVLGETAQARQLAGQFMQAVQPYQARLQSAGAHPIAAVSELLKADYILSSAPAPQRAAFMARLISDYGIDIRELDTALANTGGGKQVDPVASQVEQLLSQRLAPLNQFLAQQQQRERQQQEQSNQRITQTLEQMAANPQYPYFEDLRQDMADIIDIASKRGVHYTLEQAYARAAAMNPEVSKLVATQQSAVAKSTAAQAANARAQRALAASSSVGGAPSSVPSGAPNGSDRRAAIAAAFDSLEGR